MEETLCRPLGSKCCVEGRQATVIAANQHVFVLDDGRVYSGGDHNLKRTVMFDVETKTENVRGHDMVVRDLAWFVAWKNELCSRTGAERHSYGELIWATQEGAENALAEAQAMSDVLYRERGVLTDWCSLFIMEHEAGGDFERPYFDKLYEHIGERTAALRCMRTVLYSATRAKEKFTQEDVDIVISECPNVPMDRAW